VATPTPNCFEMALEETPDCRSCRILAESSALLGRPSRLPLKHAFRSPALTWQTHRSFIPCRQLRRAVVSRSIVASNRANTEIPCGNNTSNCSVSNGCGLQCSQQSSVSSFESSDHPLISCEMLIPNASAKVAKDRKHGSLSPLCSRDVNGLCRPT
jgi:hypothetical protein